MSLTKMIGKLNKVNPVLTEFINGISKLFLEVKTATLFLLYFRIVI